MNATSKVKLLARVYIHVAQVVPLYNYAVKLEQYVGMDQNNKSCTV